jgi:hypothetical protein
MPKAYHFATRWLVRNGSQSASRPAFQLPTASVTVHTSRLLTPRNALKNSDVVSRLQNLGFYTEGAGTPEETGAYIRGQFKTWAMIIKDIGLAPE